MYSTLEQFVASLVAVIELLIGIFYPPPPNNNDKQPPSPKKGEARNSTKRFGTLHVYNS